MNIQINQWVYIFLDMNIIIIMSSLFSDILCTSKLESKSVFSWKKTSSKIYVEYKEAIIVKTQIKKYKLFKESLFSAIKMLYKGIQNKILGYLPKTKILYQATNSNPRYRFEYDKDNTEIN